MYKKRIGLCFLICIFFAGYSKAHSDDSFQKEKNTMIPLTVSPAEKIFVAPSSIPKKIIENIIQNQKEFIFELSEVLAEEKEYLLILVDKHHPLPDGYTPKNLVALTNTRAYAINRSDLSLTKTAEEALHIMARAARKDGVTLLVSSSYRSYLYQVNLFARYVRESGEKAAERFSARPGTSQHQLGTVVDFGSITNEFANTRAGKWMEAHAGNYGWSLSFPKDYETVTGYVWESWHFRYIGIKACRLQKKWFNDIQQYMLEFIDAWKRQVVTAEEQPKAISE
ncbi:serine-type D-Ala-D-Ala carboxypeptidase [Treponema phagedenis F0421]|uniref:M15 family metallopeptidase n=1 Tax=Treponema phagedenis TaxID=162 RepID=UPI0001F639AF|nr:M15 family metallopeptidase [Treponema phagedenis]EFW36360.1 serine-type D-Ala-D-Ala carboxypeptidase [Treponema phagedenis F0421]